MNISKLIFCVFSLLILSSFSMDEWKLVKSKNEIQVFTKKSSTSDFDLVKVETVVEASLSQIVSVLEDLDAQVDWVYGTKDIKLLEQKSSQECEYLYYMEMPFPVKDRDVITNYTRTQNSETKEVTTVSKSVRAQELLSDGYARIREFQSNYTLTPLGEGKIKIVYLLQADPGSNLPSWLINKFTTSGPYKSMDALVKMIKKDKYKNAKVKDLIN